MRIVDSYSHGPLKCTLFINDNEYTLKMEDEFGAVSYKLKHLENDKLNSIKTFLKVKNIEKEIIGAFRAMRNGREQLLSMMRDQEESDEVII